MPANEADPFVGVLFEVDFGDHLKGMFFECKGFGSSTQVIDVQQQNKAGHRVNLKTPGTLSWTDITLSKGITSSLELWTWLGLVEKGDLKGARTNGTITLLDHELKPVAKFTFKDAWPTSISGPTLAADGNDFGVEQVTITHHGYVREKV